MFLEVTRDGGKVTELVNTDKILYIELQEGYMVLGFSQDFRYGVDYTPALYAKLCVLLKVVKL
jgi:hypothetical protein